MSPSLLLRKLAKALSSQPPDAVLKTVRRVCKEELGVLPKIVVEEQLGPPQRAEEDVLYVWLGKRASSPIRLSYGGELVRVVGLGDNDELGDLQ